MCRSLGSFSQPILALVRWFEKNVLRDSLNAFAQKGEPVYLFFDEVQNLKTWAPQFKSLVDHVAAKTLITGSSALRIADGQDSLAGRISMIELGPLRLGEIVGVRQIGDLPPFQPSADIEDWTREGVLARLGELRSSAREDSEKAFDAFSDVGGYPECHKPGETRHEAERPVSGRHQKLVVERTLIHDLKAGPGGRRGTESAGRDVSAGLSLRGPGSPCSTYRRGSRAKCSVRASGTNLSMTRFDFLANALLVHEIPPLEALTKRQAHPSKLCLCDHFVREAWLQEQVPIAPRQLANANEAVSTTAGHLIESDIGYYLKGIPA